jgi:repressor LexA
MTVGERIKDRRLELGLSADELAKRLGKNRATIYRYESNEIENLSITILEPLAKVLGVSPAYLMGWEEPNNITPIKTKKAPS